VCALLSSQSVALQSATHVQNQLLFLALIANRLSKSLVGELEDCLLWARNAFEEPRPWVSGVLAQIETWKLTVLYSY